MVSFLGEELASPLVFGADAHGLKLDVTQNALTRWTEAQEPYLILTTSFALMHLLTGLHAFPKAPVGSRLMLTGGFKGKTRAVTETELLNRIEDQLGIGASQVRGEYGMTELSSQAYGSPFQSPPWLRMRVVDPVTRIDVAPKNEGLVAFFDLLNLDNVSAILTSDCGMLDSDGRLTLLGRAPGSRTRGCSLQAEDWEVV